MSGSEWSPRLDRKLAELREQYPDVRKAAGGWTAGGKTAPTLAELAELLVPEE